LTTTLCGDSKERGRPPGRGSRRGDANAMAQLYTLRADLQCLRVCR
jgi:hypothetical protein